MAPRASPTTQLLGNLDARDNHAIPRLLLEPTSSHAIFGRDLVNPAGVVPVPPPMNDAQVGALVIMVILTVVVSIAIAFLIWHFVRPQDCFWGRARYRNMFGTKYNVPELKVSPPDEPGICSPKILPFNLSRNNYQAIISRHSLVSRPPSLHATSSYRMQTPQRSSRNSTVSFTSKPSPLRAHAKDAVDVESLAGNLPSISSSHLQPKQLVSSHSSRDISSLAASYNSDMSLVSSKYGLSDIPAVPSNNSLPTQGSRALSLLPCSLSSHPSVASHVSSSGDSILAGSTSEDFRAEVESAQITQVQRMKSVNVKNGLLFFTNESTIPSLRVSAPSDPSLHNSESMEVECDITEKRQTLHSPCTMTSISDMSSESTPSVDLQDFPPAPLSL